jgi:serine/threonine protein kinase
MIGYHCSFEHRGVCYALLEYADLDTLEHFMMRESSGPPSTDTEILLFWENLLHVIQAIGEIHELDPRDPYATDSDKFTRSVSGLHPTQLLRANNRCSIHQDIKPTNILVKSKAQASSIYDSAFGLADLGTSSLVKAGSSRVARDNYGTKTYGKQKPCRISVHI